LSEAVADGITGVLVRPGDVADLTAAMRRLLAEPALRRRMGETGRARVLSEFSVDSMVEGNLAVYRRACAGRKP
jgi:glycosyltransferase involved in cell wall biosynthesis